MPRSLAGWHLAVCVLGAAGCRAAVPDEESLAAVRALPACAPLPAPDRTWPRRSAAAFSIQLPARYRPHLGGGLDSDVGRFGDRTGGVSFDYGAYANALVRTGEGGRLPGCRATIDGRAVRLVVQPSGTGAVYVAAAWRELSSDTHLTISARARDSSEVPAILAMLASVRIPGR